MIPEIGITLYNCVKYEQQLYYFNTIIRVKQKYYNPFTNDLSHVDHPELLNDYESIAETEVWKGLLTKMNLLPTKDNVIAFSRDFTNFLNKNNITDPTTLSKLRADPNFIKRKLGIDEEG